MRSSSYTPFARRSIVLAPALLLLAGVPSCGRSDGDQTSDEGRGGAASGGRRSPTLVIAPLPAPYRTADLAGGGGGSVQGVVEVDGDLPRDTVVRPASEQAICGASLVDTTIELFGGKKLGGVVVWLDRMAPG